MNVRIEEKKHDLKTNGIKTNGKNVKSDQEIWDEELADINSPQFKKLMELSQKAVDDYKNGKCTPGGFGY